jgi:hypothetical protein
MFLLMIPIARMQSLKGLAVNFAFGKTWLLQHPANGLF